MRKKNKGITLVALVITIIVLIILAMVSVNAIVGDNGILAQAMESRILTYLSDIMFNIESEIIDINISRLPNENKLTSTEMIRELKNRKLLNKEKSLFGSTGTSMLETEVNSTRLSGLTIGYNGALWLDGYKRGKIQLSSQINTIKSSTDPNKEIIVIDGNVSEVGDTPECTYELSPLEGRDDFACWVNENGEIISIFPYIRIFTLNSRKTEYTAIYDKDLRKEIINAESVIGLETYSIQRTDGITIIDIQTCHYYNTHYYLDNNLLDHLLQVSFPDSIEKILVNASCFKDSSVKPVLHYGLDVFQLGIVYSENYEDLLTENLFDKDKKPNKNLKMISVTCPYKGSDGKMYNFNNVQYLNPEDTFIYYNDDTEKEEGEENECAPLTRFDNFTRTAKVDEISINITNNLQELKDKGVKRIYYRGIANFRFVTMVKADIMTDEIFTWRIEEDKEDQSNKISYYESVIKYIDL